MWHFQVEYGSRGEKLLHWFKFCIHNLTRVLFQLESVTYTTDKHKLVFAISLLQEGWWWYCYSHTDANFLNVLQVTFDYSTLEANTSQTKNDRNEYISDFESRYLTEFITLRRDSTCTSNIHVQSDVQKHYFIYPCKIITFKTLLDKYYM